MGDVRLLVLLLLGLQNYETARGRIYSSRRGNQKLSKKFEVYYLVVLLIAKIILKTVHLLIAASEQSKKKRENDVRVDIK